MARRALIASAILLLTAGCATLEPQPQPPAETVAAVEEEEPWRKILSDDDAQALDALPRIWADALGAARRDGYARRIAAEEALLAPGAGLPRAAPPPGPYSCRILRLGPPGPGLRPLSEVGRGFCFVGADRDQLSLTIEAGPRRMGGYLWEEKDNGRLVFLGSQSPRGTPIGGYGDDRMRDVAGLFERIGTFRYRLTLPPRDSGRLTIIDMRPAPEP
ncbi:MAG TPA: DUF4893 domain-containing protein [Allosphingosinicella sp.]|jgi:hypothetical protein|nr:DUF4893 domain-containing protein [Allosphingosinicella sp.]